MCVCVCVRVCEREREREREGMGREGDSTGEKGAPSCQSTQLHAAALFFRCSLSTRSCVNSALD